MGFSISTVTVNLVFLGILFPEIAHSKVNLDTLVQAQVIWRHGARSLDSTYPFDPWKNESYWTPGYSQLTNLGKFQGYNLGLYLRERYDGFVGETYNMKDVYILSSDFARTLQTAYSVMAGFYLPNQILSKDNETDYLVNNDIEIPLPWKSAVVHTTPVQYDNILRQAADICPRYLHLYQNLPRDSEDMERFFQNATFVSDYIYKETGWKPPSIKDLLLTLDTLYLEQFYNMTLPTWAKQLIADATAHDMFLYFFQIITYTDEMKRLRVGPLIEKLVQNMVMNETSLKDEFERSRSGRKKIYFFSGHDATIAGLFNTLGIFDKKRPPFTSAVILELHQRQKFDNTPAASEQNFLYLEIYYRNETDHDPYQLEIPGCGIQCPVADFIKLTEPYVPQNWNQECQFLNETSTLSAGWIILIVLCVWILLFILLQVWLKSSCFNFINNRKRRSSYSHLT